MPPPARIPVKATIARYIPGHTAEENPAPETIHEFDSNDIYATYLGQDISVRITPTVAGELRKAVEHLYTDSAALLEVNDQAASDPHLQPKVEAIGSHLDNDDKWISILGDRQLPKPGKSDSLVNGLLLVSDSELPVPNKPTVIFNVLILNPLER